MTEFIRSGALTRAAQRVWSGLCYTRYVLFHPFDGFWCAQREKRGNAGSATVILLLMLVGTVFSKRATGYIFNYYDPGEFNFLTEALGVLAPVLLWCVVNWSITTLMDGEGTFRDIYIATAYALAPMILFSLIQTVMSWFLTQDAQEVYTLLSSVGMLWTGFLLFTGVMTIQQYTVKKTLLTIAMDIVGMMAVLFFFLLFFALIQQVVNFVSVLYTEFLLRI